MNIIVNDNQSVVVSLSLLVNRDPTAVNNIRLSKLWLIGTQSVSQLLDGVNRGSTMVHSNPIV